MPLPARHYVNKSFVHGSDLLKNQGVLLSVHAVNCVFCDLDYLWPPLYTLHFPHCCLKGTVKSQKQDSSSDFSTAVLREKVPVQLILALPLEHVQASHWVLWPEHWNRSVKDTWVFLVNTSTGLSPVRTPGFLCIQTLHSTCLNWTFCWTVFLSLIS